MRRIVLVLTAVLSLIPLVASAQADMTLPSESRVFLHGMLTASHARGNHGHYDGAYHQHYLYWGVAGDSVRISATGAPPRPVRAAVALYGPGNPSFLADDGGLFIDPLKEGRPVWSASVERRLPASGQYVICVHSHDAGSTGDYALSLSADRATAGADSPNSGTTSTGTPNYPRAYLGTTYNGRLETGDHRIEGRYHDDWLYRGRAGERVSITMDSHGSAFDPELFLYRGWSGLDADILACDNDAGEGMNARIQATLPVDGEYVILAAARNAGADGSYTLRVNGAAETWNPSQTSGCSPGRATSAGPPAPPSSEYPFQPEPTRIYHLQSGRFQPGDALTPDGRYYDTWLHTPDETRRYAIHVRSDQVDTDLELYVVNPNGAAVLSLLARDDDSGAGTSACVEMTLTAGTTYLLVARARAPGAVGSYRAQFTYPSVLACGE